MPKRVRDHTKMTSDDEHASRVFSLAIKFYGSRRPISVQDIHSELYPGLKDESFARAFYRDRALLASCGVLLCDVSEKGDQSFWKIDEEASYVAGEGISEQDGRLLQVLCSNLVSDSSFAYRDELRMALAKLGRLTRATGFAQEATGAANRLLASLVSAQSNQKLVKVTYRGADGVERKRTLAIYGSFGFHGRSYFVAASCTKGGQGEPGSIRTYRLDRFVRVQELAESHYSIPADFCVDDYILLPFQMGDTCMQAVFTANGHLEGETKRAMENYGEFQETEPLRWAVELSEPELAAMWALGAGLIPVEPAELVAQYQKVKDAAGACELIDENSNSLPPLTKAAGRAGRIGGAVELRQLITLAANLDAAGKTLTDEDIQTALGVDRIHARHLIMMLGVAYGESIDYLPVIPSEADDEVSLMEGAAVRGRRIRLTKGETHALLAALTTLGIPAGDPLHATLERDYGTTIATGTGTALPAERANPDELETLQELGRIIVEKCCATFLYTVIGEKRASERHVVPLSCRRMHERWYLDAYDLTRKGMRCFILSAIEQLTAGEQAPELEEMLLGERSRTQQEVQVLFNDKRLVDLFNWDDLRVLGEGEDTVLVSMPWYGGSWLPRHLAACGSKVQVNSSSLLACVQHEAARLR